MKIRMQKSACKRCDNKSPVNNLAKMLNKNANKFCH